MSASYEQLDMLDPAARTKLVEEHAELVKRIAYHLLARMPPSIDVDDLIQAGMIGLLNAAQNYSASKGANFATYAGIRIRGAMLDEARRLAYTPRSTFRHAREVAGAIRAVEQATGRHASAKEIAERLGVGVDEYHRMVESAASSKMLSLDELGAGSDDGLELGSAEDRGPFESVQDDMLRRDLARVIATLPTREQLVLSLYYEQEMNLREIGEILEVGESRVCQIHGQAVMRIRARLGAWLDGT